MLRQIQQTVNELLGAEIPADQVRLVLSLYQYAVATPQLP